MNKGHSDCDRCWEQSQQKHYAAFEVHDRRLCHGCCEIEYPDVYKALMLAGEPD